MKNSFLHSALIIYLITIPAIAAQNDLNYIDVYLDDGTPLTIPAEKFPTFARLTRKYSYFGSDGDTFTELDQFMKALSFISFSDTNELSPIYERYSRMKFFYNCIDSYTDTAHILIGFIDSKDTQLRTLDAETMLSGILIRNESIVYRKGDGFMMRVLNLKQNSGFIKLEKNKIVKGKIIVDASGYIPLIFNSDYLLDKNVVWLTLRIDKDPKQDLELQEFNTKVEILKTAFPKHFLIDAVITISKDIKRMSVYGEPNPPEGFAGSDPTGKHVFGIYLPYGYEKIETFSTDISPEQWIFHEMFHLHNRRTGEYNKFIDTAFPDENDPLVQWIKKDPYHRTFAREEAFINLITFADPARTDNQKAAVREYFDYIGAKDLTIPEIKKVLKVIPH